MQQKNLIETQQPFKRSPRKLKIKGYFLSLMKTIYEKSTAKFPNFEKTYKKRPVLASYFQHLSNVEASALA